MRRVIILCCTVVFALSAFGQTTTKRHIFEEALNAALAEGAFKPGSEWVPYPAYSDRAGWDKLSGENRNRYIEIGEMALKHVWKPTLASTYLEFEKSGNRALMNDHNTRLACISNLIIAELIEGKGRFLPHLIDGLWLLCSSEISWSHAAHTSYQPSKRTLPIEEERPITLHSSNHGMVVAYALHFFKEQFDKIDPSIAHTLKSALKKNILNPYLNTQKKMWWMGNLAEGRRLNNWAPYCTTNTVTVFLLCEENPDHLIKALKQSAVTMDIYMNDQGFDGACDEGPSYWDMAAGKAYEYARLMADASGGKMNVFNDELLRRMGEFKSKTYLADDYVMNFADGLCRDIGDLTLIYRYGVDVGSQEMIDFAISQMAVPSQKMFKSSVKVAQLQRTLETLRYDPKLLETQQNTLTEYEDNFYKLKRGLEKNIGSVWYDQTEYAILRKGKMILAAKAGNNAENHNHNDVGCGILFVDSRPVIIDPGVGTYTKTTFGSKRYTIWNNQSDWHSVPKINGMSQINGREFAAKDAACNLNRTEFSANIAGAYPADAACRYWNRKWKLTDNEMIVTDTYELSERKSADIENFVFRGDVYLPKEVTSDGYKVKAGEIVVTAYSYSKKGKVNILMSYPKQMTPTITVQDLTSDKRMVKSWGKELKRVSFTSPDDAPLKGSYEFRIEILNN